MEQEIMPKVSVITPVYNGEAYIKTAIESVLSQSIDDWELVIVDDGSSDSTPEILRQFTDKRIKVVRQENSGEASARNTALKHASGEYVAFLDADDYYFPNALGDLSSFLDRHPEYGVVYSNGQISDSANKPIMTLTEIRPGIYTGNILEKVVVSSSVITVPVCTMTRRSQIFEHSIQFDRNLVIGPDWDFWIQLAAHVGFGYLDRITCNYRVHNMNITRTIDLKKRKRDQIFGRLKAMNSSWFIDLPSRTKERFFYDLLLNITSGDPATQTTILHSEQFNTLPNYAKAYFWRMVGIDVLQNDHDTKHARDHLLESLKIEPNNRKTRFLLWCLSLGRLPVLGLINFWRLLLQAIKSLASVNNAKSKRLQKLFGMR